MEIHDASTLLMPVPDSGDGVKVARLYPTDTGRAGGGLLAVDLWELDPGASTPLHRHAEEHVLFVISGTGELRGSAPGSGGVSALLRAGSVAHIAPDEPHTLRNTGGDKLRVVVSTPLLVWSVRAPGRSERADRALEREDEGKEKGGAAGILREPSGVSATPVSPVTPVTPVTPVAPNVPAVASGADTTGEDGPESQPLPDISKLVRRASEIQSAPRAERERRRAAPGEPATAQAGPQAGQQEPAVEEEEGPGNMLELLVVFDGGSRGNPGQGYGSFLVQSPERGRRPVVRRLEFGDNYTNNQAEYDTLIACLNYIIERLTATGRSPSQVLLDIRNDSELVVNQLLGTYKVKDASMKRRHQQAMELLEQFADWRIEWQPRDETVRLLGH